MNQKTIFNFKNEISAVSIPKELNNPFSKSIPEIAQLASQEFQEYIATETKNWDYNFETQKGKMFGVLVVQQADDSLAYLGAVSGVLASGTLSKHMVPNVFQENSENPFISEGLTDIKKLGLRIQAMEQEVESKQLKAKRKAFSNSLQKRLFEETQFLNIKGECKNVLRIFEAGNYGYPPASAGECSAPKLLQYALHNNLKPIAIAEFWWGNTPKSMERKHKGYYPACKEKCRPILEYILNDTTLYNRAK